MNPNGIEVRAGRDQRPQQGTKRRKGPKGRKRPVPVFAEDNFRDRIARSLEREREHAQVPRWPPEYDSVFAHFFWCVCCGRTRGEELRREPASEVCVHCVAAAGFWN
jgi:hypothetical protein